MGNRHHPKVIGSVDIEQGEWELYQPKLLDPQHIRHGWITPSPASRRPIRAQLGAPNSRASGPRFLRTLHQTVPRASPEPPRSTPNPQTTTNMLLLRVFVFGLEGAAGRQERHLFSRNENKLTPNPQTTRLRAAAPSPPSCTTVPT